MSSLTTMSADELSKLLDEYGIKHGPVVGPTHTRPIKTYKNTYFTSVAVKSAEETQAQSCRLIPVWVQIVLFLAVAVFFYMVFASMETKESFRGLE